MDASRFDRIAQVFAERRLSRRPAVTASVAAGVATATAAAAQEATPPASPAASPVADYELGSYDKTMYLFVQSFQSGSLVPNEADDRHTLTLAQGLGQTIYFGDRPSRDVGVTPTAQFLEGLGFTEDNPPNAALIVDTGEGETDLAVLELFAPTYDTATHTATYQVQGLEAWEESLDLGLQDAPTDLSGITPDFGAAHLLIDDCLDGQVDCYAQTGPYVASYTNLGFCYAYGICMPCDPYGHNQPDRCSTPAWWDAKCMQDYPDACGISCSANFTGYIFLGC
jgi:hypothetical protein